MSGKHHVQMGQQQGMGAMGMARQAFAPQQQTMQRPMGGQQQMQVVDIPEAQVKQMMEQQQQQQFM